MSFHWCDNIHTTVFTPRDYQVELLAAAYERNTMICLGHKSSKEFIALKLLQEFARQARTSGKISLYLTCDDTPSMAMVHHLTDLKVHHYYDQQQADANDVTRDRLPLGYQVYVMHPRVCLTALRNKTISLNQVHLLILEDCHVVEVHRQILPIFREFFCLSTTMTANEIPKVLALAGPLHSAGCSLQELSAMLNTLEENAKCTAETASDIVTVLRYCSKPIEYIVQCAPYQKDELTFILEEIICTRRAFLNDHRYDPTEIYNTDEYLEELKDIPDPKREPLEFLDTILSVLYEMGPWCADRVAINMFHRIEKQKIKTPHERHYILLCLVNTALFEIHAICEQSFRKFTNHKDLIERYSSPKVRRLFEILRLFKPEEFASASETIKKCNVDLEQLDFQKLTRTLEYSCQNVEVNAAKKQLESRSIVENLDAIVKTSPTTTASSSSYHHKHGQNEYSINNRSQLLNKIKLENCSPSGRRQRDNTSSTTTATSTTTQGRTKRRPFIRRHMRDNGDALDTLCGIIFCSSNYTARVLFDLIAEMSRHDSDLKFLKCQYTTDRMADPLTEPKEAEVEHRRQEDVLKRFRMRDCNILIGTAILEEGIDVPKCNLVIRWDPPTTYRSYVQCKGRARAVPAYHITLVAPSFELQTNSCKEEQLSDRCHRCLCKVDESQNAKNSTDSDDSENTTSNGESDSSNDDSENDEKNSNKLRNEFTIDCSAKGRVKILNPEVLTNKPPITIKPTAAAKVVDATIFLAEIKCKDDGNDDDDDGAKIENHVNEISELVSNDVETPLNTDIITALNLPTKTTPTKIETTTTLNSSDNNKCISEYFEVLNLSDLIDEENSSKINSPAPLKKKEKRKFRCFAEKGVEKDAFGGVSEEEDTHKNEFKNDSVSFYESKIAQMENITTEIVDQLAQYRELEKMLLEKCANIEPPESEHRHADKFTHYIEPYKPKPLLLTGASVDMGTSIALVNKYCSKLPSDTFTKLTALWRCAKTYRNDEPVFQYTLRLPINSPLKYDIVGVPMATHILARRMAALQACIELHKSGELDNNLQPIGKEGFRAIESDWETFELESQDEKIVQENSEPRPGTTKRRQYYYKRIASEFCNCRPIAGVPCYLYLLDLTLQCPIPEEQNTRGRKIYPPEDAHQGFGILTLKKIPKVSSFPIFTRSGEVKVSIVLSQQQIVLTEEQISCINSFLNYTFTNVLRLQKFLMLFDPDSTENCVFIVPTIKTEDGGKIIDWKFLKLIEQNSGMMPTPVPEDARKSIEFDSNRFKDAVVMPWYRNQDQPQYFYVAEICPQLSPLSCFPGESYHTFKHYYNVKYELNIQNSNQPLLDVDHTSARLNFLTPRYVNRKGVALPTSSEETKRAKRENLEQKQILVPELCTVHPFPASLWRTAVCLPCILYRINGLLLADDIRKKVAADIGLGQQQIDDQFEWPMLDFGWSLSEVLKKSKESKQTQEQRAEEAKVKSDGCEKENHMKEKTNVNGDNGDNDANMKSKSNAEKSANEIVIEGEQKLKENFIEIGTWSNDMAQNINLNKNSDLTDDDEDEEEYMKYLPPNVSFCDQRMRYGSPTFWDVQEPNANSGDATDMEKKTAHNRNRNGFQKSSFAYYDSDDSLDSTPYDHVNGGVNYSSDDNDDDDDTTANNSGALRIEFTSKHEAETIESEQEIEKRNKKLSIIQATNANERKYQETKNLQVGYNFVDLKNEIQKQLKSSIEQFIASTESLKEGIRKSGMLVEYNKSLVLPRKENSILTADICNGDIRPKMIWDTIRKMLSYVRKDEWNSYLQTRGFGESGTSDGDVCVEINSITVDDIVKLNLNYVFSHPDELFVIEGCGDIFDNFNDKSSVQLIRQSNGDSCKQIKLNFEKKFSRDSAQKPSAMSAKQFSNAVKSKEFSFDYQPDLMGHPGPSPSIILQALTMSNANDGINLERLETIGDSFLKYAITTYLYITYENVHEGKLSHLRSKQVANLNLYRLGRRKILGEYMIATKFEPHDNWLPPCYYVPKELEKALIEAKIPPHHWKLVDLPNIKKLSSSEICELVRQKADKLGLFNDDFNNYEENDSCAQNEIPNDGNDFTCFIPYNLVTQHSIPDKSVADCVEAIIGAYLIECGSRGALLFMAWLGIRVLPYTRLKYDPNEQQQRIPGSTNPDADQMIKVYGEWTPPKSPLLHYSPNAEEELESMLEGFDEFEATIGYKFNDRSYLLQAMTHASYSPNRLTDCYQRLEFLGDAVLDYLITRHLYEDPRQHSPGALTDLRSALVNNTIFASLAVRHGFHKYFRHLSPGLNEVIDRFVRIQNENGHSISEEYYLLSEEECDDAEDVEVPKALGDVFESVAGAIFLDSNMSLDVVWKVYSNMMKPEIEQFSNSVPKSPIRELLELEPETAKFGKPEKLADGRRVRVTVDVFCKGTFRGIGRNYRIAKCTAAKCALRQLKKQGLISKKD